MEAEGKYIVQSGGLVRYARVRISYRAEVQIASDAPRAEVDPKLINKDRLDPERIEAALDGLACGLKLACAPGNCVLLEIAGLPGVGTTTPSAMMRAGLRAAWAAVGFQPEEVLATSVADYWCDLADVLKGNKEQKSEEILGFTKG